MINDGRRGRILATTGELRSPVQAEAVAEAICRFAVDQLAASGCAVTLMSPSPSMDVLASAGSQAAEIAELQFSLGEGPCLD
ncbi:MAG: hypothetical protein ACJ786_32080, partial [Catenulispora sp.]